MLAIALFSAWHFLSYTSWTGEPILSKLARIYYISTGRCIKELIKFWCAWQFFSRSALMGGYLQLYIYIFGVETSPCMSPYKEDKGHTAFGPDPNHIWAGVSTGIDMTLPCLHNISWTTEQILSKLAGIHYWDMLKSWRVLVCLKLISKLSQIQGHLFLWKQVVLYALTKFNSRWFRQNVTAFYQLNAYTGMQNIISHKILAYSCCNQHQYGRAPDKKNW